MSTSAITSSDPSSSAQDSVQLIQQELQQVGQDLQAGNMSAAESDFVSLESSVSKVGGAGSQISGTIHQEFSQLAADLQSGHLSTSDVAYAKIGQSLQAKAAPTHQGTKAQASPHTHHAGVAGSSELTQLTHTLGAALKSGTLSTAQQTYDTLQSDLAQMSSDSSPSTSTSLFVTD